MQVVPDFGWLADRDARYGKVPADTVALLRLRAGLRGLYQDALGEPLPEHLAVVVRELERREGTNEAKPE